MKFREMTLAGSVSHQLLTMKHVEVVIVLILSFSAAAPRGVVVPEAVQDFHEAVMKSSSTAENEVSGSGTDSGIGSGNGNLTIASGEPEEVVGGGVIQTISSITITYIVVVICVLIWFSLFWICCFCLTSPCCFIDA